MTSGKSPDQRSHRSLLFSFSSLGLRPCFSCLHSTVSQMKNKRLLPVYKRPAFATALPKTSSEGRLLYMALEIFLEDEMSTAASMQDLKSIDVGAMGIVFFMPLNSNLKHPFSADLSSSHLPWREVIKSKFLKKEKATHDAKYQVFLATNWFLIFEAYERWTCFMPTERPSASES